MQIHVKTLTGSIISFEVDKNDLVEDLKNKISEKTSIGVD